MSDANITYVGYAALLIERDGLRILTDQLLRRSVGFLRRRWPMPDADLGDVDTVLISHLHGVHIDLGSLERAGRDVRLNAPLGAGDYSRARHVHDVEEVEQGDLTWVGGLGIRATRANHVGSPGQTRSLVPTGPVVANEDGMLSVNSICQMDESG